VFELGVVAYAAYAFDTRFLQVLTDSQQLILVQLLVRGIDADVTGFGTSIATFDEAKAGGDENEDMAERVDATTGGTKGGVE
jgi:hypothetical protein